MDHLDAGGSAGAPLSPNGMVGRQVEELRAALAMLTRLPVPGPLAPGAGARAFGAVGALIGLTGFVPMVVFGPAVPAAAAILAVATIVILSGGVHLDGLADTADALVAVGPVAAERARNDPAVGPAGASALILVLGLEIASLASLGSGPGPLIAGLTCVAAGAASRAVPVVVVGLARSRATATGLGGWFAEWTTAADAAAAGAISVLVTVACALVVHDWTLVGAGLAGGLGGVGLGLALVRVRGQLDGDLLGATVEMSFAGTVLAAAVLVGWPGA